MSAPSTFSPSAFVEQVIEAVMPLVAEDGTSLKDGKTRTDVILALQPVFGHFTVYDAVLVHFMLDPAGNTSDETPDDRDSPRRHAIFEARTALIDFAANARASSVQCAETRVYLAECEGDMDEVPDGNLYGAIAEDIKHVSRGRYRGHRFADIDRWNGGWLPVAMMPDMAPAAADDGDAA